MCDIRFDRFLFSKWVLTVRTKDSRNLRILTRPVHDYGTAHVLSLVLIHVCEVYPTLHEDLRKLGWTNMLYTGDVMDNKWRSTHIRLVVLELVLSVIFLSLSYILGNLYFRGVGIGLLIAWVTGALAYFIVKRRAGTGN
jgi:hypothetical protein